MNEAQIRQELLSDCYGRLENNIRKAERHSFNTYDGSQCEFDYTDGCEFTGDGRLIVNTKDGNRYLLTINLSKR